MTQEKEKKNDNTDLVKRLLFQQVERPKHTVQVKIINVYDNRYRINIYVEIQENGLDKKKIAASYFAKLNNDKLEITMGL